MDNNEENLLRQFLAGDDKAYEAIYLYYIKILPGKAYKKLRNEQDAEDVVQQLFTDLYVKAKRKELRIRGPLQEYLESKLYKACDELLAIKRAIRKFNSFMRTYWKNGIQYSESESMLSWQALNLAIDQVKPPAVKKILKLIFLENKSSAEIAKELSIKIQVVRNQRCKGIKSLKDIIRKQF